MSDFYAVPRAPLVAPVYGIAAFAIVSLLPRSEVIRRCQGMPDDNRRQVIGTWTPSTRRQRNGRSINSNLVPRAEPRNLRWKCQRQTQRVPFLPIGAQRGRRGVLGSI